MIVEIVEGDLLEQDVEVIVNAWNRNILPWWLLIPQGVSAAIKRRAGTQPFQELRKIGVLPLGAAVETGPGELGFRSIIHVAGINVFWFATKDSIQKSVKNAMAIVDRQGYSSVAFPVIGAGSGNFSAKKALDAMLEAFGGIESRAQVYVVKYAPQAVTPEVIYA